jgi:large subunit ribosomal protein L3
VKIRDAVKRAAPAGVPTPGAFRKAGGAAAAPVAAETPAEEAPAVEASNEGGES